MPCGRNPELTAQPLCQPTFTASISSETGKSQRQIISTLAMEIVLLIMRQGTNYKLSAAQDEIYVVTNRPRFI